VGLVLSFKLRTSGFEFFHARDQDFESIGWVD
jgi:hypothetical protein